MNAIEWIVCQTPNAARRRAISRATPAKASVELAQECLRRHGCVTSQMLMLRFRERYAATAEMNKIAKLLRLVPIAVGKHNSKTWGLPK